MTASAWKSGWCGANTDHVRCLGEGPTKGGVIPCACTCHDAPADHRAPNETLTLG